MSLKSWKKEFYSPISRCPKSKAIEHSIKKWEGALPENLEKHGCKYDGGAVIDSGMKELEFDGDSCALCWKFCEVESDVLCDKCPIVDTTGKDCWEAYDMSFDDPQPMLNLLYHVKHLRDIDKVKKKV